MPRLILQTLTLLQLLALDTFTQRPLWDGANCPSRPDRSLKPLDLKLDRSYLPDSRLRVIFRRESSELS